MKKEQENNINEMLESKDEGMLAEHQVWGKNPKRSQLLRDVWLDSLIEEIEKEKMPEKAKQELLFLMTANGVLDVIMESLPEELAVELSYSFDQMIGATYVNKKFGVDLLETNYEVISKIKRDNYKTDEEFESAVTEKDEKWWTIGKQQLGGRSPNDAIAEALSKYGLNQ